MKAFVARALVAPLAADFHHALDGELVTPALLPCDCPDCGCRRSMAGIASARATSMFTVAELPMTFTEYVGALRDGLQRQGWWRADSDDGWLLPLAAGLSRAAALLPEGAPLQLRDTVVSVRKAAA